MTPEEISAFERFKKQMICSPEQIKINPDWTRIYAFGQDDQVWKQGHLTEEEIAAVMGECSTISYVHFTHGEELTRGTIY